MNLPTLLSKAKELGEKATEGPLMADGDLVFSSDGDGFAIAYGNLARGGSEEDNAAFIAFARSALPLLVRIVERQGEALSIIENDGHSFHDRDLHTDIAAEAIAECEKIAAEITGGREGE